MSWCVQKAKLRAKWKQILLTVDWKAILCILGAVFPAILLFYAITGFERRPLDIWSSAFLILRTIAATPSTFNPERISARLFHMLSLHICFFSASLIVSFIFIIIASPNYEHQISCFEEVVDSNFRLAAEEEMEKFLIGRNMVNVTFSHLQIHH